MWKKAVIVAAVVIAAAIALLKVTNSAKRYDGIQVSPDGARAIFASGYANHADSGIYLVDFDKDKWTFYSAPKNTVWKSPIWSSDGRNILAVVSNEESKESQAVEILLDDGNARSVFRSKMNLESLVRYGENDLIYSERPHCDLSPSERCGGLSDLYLYKMQTKIHLRLTKIWGSFGSIHPINKNSIVVYTPFLHLPDGDNRGKSCAEIDRENPIFQIDFPQPIEETTIPVQTDCTWKPLFRGILGTVYGTAFDGSGSRILYVSLDTSQPKYAGPLYIHDLKSGKDTLVRKSDSTDWPYIDMTPDEKVVVSLHDFRSKVPTVWRKNTVDGTEQIFELSSQKLNVIPIKGL